MRLAAWLLTPLLISGLILLIANQIAQPPAQLKPRIFVIGLSKTGTSSIGDALALLKYKRLGWKDIRSRHLVHTWANADYAALIDQTRYFDAYEDLPWPFMYKQMSEMYPDAKFILSLRKDERTWLESLRRHVGRGRWRPYSYFYGAQEVDGNEATVLEAYRNHTAAVREYFSAMPDRYVEIVIDDGDANWEVLCRVARCEGGLPAEPFPKSNTAAHWKNGALLDRLHGMWMWSITRLEEISAASYYGGGWSGINALLAGVWKIISVIEQAFSELYYKTAVVPAPPLTFQDVHSGSL